MYIINTFYENGKTLQEIIEGYATKYCAQYVESSSDESGVTYDKNI